MLRWMAARGALRMPFAPERAPSMVLRRALVTTPAARQEQGTHAPRLTDAAAYPFAAHVVTRSHEAPRPDSVRPPPQKTNDPSRGVMRRVDGHLTAEIDPDEKIARLFSRRSPECVPPGSILLVESYLSASKTNTTTFSGVLIAVRRAGIATSFVLRAIAHKLGVEARFHAYSPMIKEIRVIQRADARKGEHGLQRTRRAKLYYMRRRDDRRVNAVANIVKQYRASEMQQAERARKQQKPQAKKKK
ncbi:hypothetical protein MBRA1_003774 [Malassezia brasiliensis]|uniref:Ribosomal protein L19 n=1 Tax=Malassezia brasiliensis TaxID=1821822 RepID=A0AAF0DW06_9BASI|nr:hypothetical protein MBRA1_003774 [Malassezia brasiliensis]